LLLPRLKVAEKEVGKEVGKADGKEGSRVAKVAEAAVVKAKVVVLGAAGVVRVW
jgi:hypothetical protein